MGQGTFYLYFTSKKQIFDELVLDLNARVRHAMTEAAARGKTRAEKERLGFAAFFRFTAEHPALYRIIRQAEFVSPETLQQHYERLTSGYVSGLRQAMEDGEIEDGDPELLAWALMGIGELVGMRWVLWAGQDELAPELSQELGRIITRTLGAREDGRVSAVGVAGTAHYLPERWMSAAEVAAESGIPEDVIVEKFGLRGKHIAGDDEHVSDLAVAAASRLLEEPSSIPPRSTSSCTSARPGRTIRSGRRPRGSRTGSAAAVRTPSSTTTSRWARRSRCVSPARSSWRSRSCATCSWSRPAASRTCSTTERALALHVQLRRRRGCGAAGVGSRPEPAARVARAHRRLIRAPGEGAGGRQRSAGVGGVGARAPALPGRRRPGADEGWARRDLAGELRRRRRGARSSARCEPRGRLVPLRDPHEAVDARGHRLASSASTLGAPPTSTTRVT